MSSNQEVIWSIVKNTSSFIRKSHGITLTAEPFNVRNLNAKKYSGLANKKAIDLKLSKDGTILFSKKRRHLVRKPSKMATTGSLTKHVTNHNVRGAYAIRKDTEGSFYRPDLSEDAIARYRKLHQAKKRIAPRKAAAKPSQEVVKA
ncbi:Large ribosomal subunit protein eL28 [Plasmodiophora brassicae]|uniref:Ribosomal eL28/Mak16 domain-containing protein n=1 Tax=Plasmodiophora brassicae TaxID=37360 RepID=A0A0G4IHD9_PLABS|nr:hypothetical protein PBRA_000354 [Plasmodiophora brassicae]